MDYSHLRSIRWIIQVYLVECPDLLVALLGR